MPEEAVLVLPAELFPEEVLWLVPDEEPPTSTIVLPEFPLELLPELDDELLPTSTLVLPAPAVETSVVELSLLEELLPPSRLENT